MNSTGPMVSVVVPCYNGERFVAEAIESALSQSRGPIEVIVVDDGSTDGSIAVVEPYAADGRVTLLRHPSNRGIAAARNSGIRAAKGRYIGFLDQDDLWLEDKVARLLPVFEGDPDGKIGLVFSEVEMRSVGVEEKKRRRVRVPDGVENLEPDELLSRLFLSDFVAIVTALIRRDCFEKVGLLDESIRSGSDDFDLLVRIAQRYRFAYVDRVLAVRRLHGENYTDPERMVPDALRVIERVAARRPALAATVPKARSHHLFRLARDLHVKKQYARARRAYLEAIRARPANPKPLAGLLFCNLDEMGDLLLSTVRRVAGRR